MIRVSPLPVLLLWLFAGALWAQPGGIDLDARQLERYHALNAELRCLVCQNRSIAESDVPLAQDLKNIVARQIAAGRSDAEIKAYLVERYGDWVLYDPPFSLSTFALWLGPFLLLGIGLVAALMIMRHGRRPPADAAPVDRRRLSEVLGGERRAGDEGADESSDNERER